MLRIQLTAQDSDILEVQEVIMGGANTQTRYWYYDTKNWLKSSHGRKGDTPDRAMSEADIKWVTQYYLPNVQALAA